MERGGADGRRPYLSPTPDGGLYWGDLEQGTLVARYKRFLADVRLDDGRLVTAHTANTGAMLGCCEPGRPVWLSRHNNPKRKLEYTLELIAMPSALVGVNTGVPNRLVKAALTAGRVPGIPRSVTVRSEVRVGDSRLDLMLTLPDGTAIPVEIKNCSLCVDGTAMFPDAVTVRGARHLEELARLAEGGSRAILFILVQRGDALRFAPADHIDPVWGQTLRRVVRRGVQVMAHRADITLERIDLGQSLPVML